MKGFIFLITLTGALLAGIAGSAASTVEMTITVGGKAKSVVIELDEATAPKSSANFKKLCSEGFFNGIAFHRVIPNYIVQGGDPLTKDTAQKLRWGTGGPGYKVPAEFGGKHVRGAVAAARLEDSVNPDKASSGSQFYVALRDISALDGDYTVFGKVTMGLEYFDEIARMPADTNGNPVDRVEIISTKVTESAPSSSLPPMPKVTGEPAKDAPVIAAADKAPAPAPAFAPAPAAPAPMAVAPATKIPPIPKLPSETAELTEPDPIAAVETAPAPDTTPKRAGGGLPPMPSLTTAPSEPPVSAALAAAAAPSEGRELQPIPEAASSTEPSYPAPDAPAFGPASASAQQPPAATMPLGLPTQAATPAGEQPLAPAAQPAPKKPEKPPGFFGKFLRKYW